MNKRNIISITALLLVFIGTTLCFASNDDLKTIEKIDTVSVKDGEQYRNLIENEIVSDDITYKLEKIEEIKNKKLENRYKEISEEKIVPISDASQVLKLFNNEKKITEDGYTGVLEIQNDSLKIYVNETYEQEYKVFLKKYYKNIDKNELNNIPKTIKENGTTYYLVDPVWEVSVTEKIENNNVPILYNGTMNYEGIKTKNVIKNYIAVVNYKGNLEKEIIDSITFKLKYKELEVLNETKQQIEYKIPTAITTTSGIMIFSGIILLKNKNVKIYNYNKSKPILIKRLHISKKDSTIDITPVRAKSNKYKIILSNRLFNQIKNQSMYIKYFDKKFIYRIDNKEFEINV